MGHRALRGAVRGSNRVNRRWHRSSPSSRCGSSAVSSAHLLWNVQRVSIRVQRSTDPSVSVPGEASTSVGPQFGLFGVRRQHTSNSEFRKRESLESCQLALHFAANRDECEGGSHIWTDAEH